MDNANATDKILKNFIPYAPIEKVVTADCIMGARPHLFNILMALGAILIQVIGEKRSSRRASEL
jgi:hypothetical protein